MTDELKFIRRRIQRELDEMVQKNARLFNISEFHEARYNAGMIAGYDATIGLINELIASINGGDIDFDEDDPDA